MQDIMEPLNEFLEEVKDLMGSSIYKVLLYGSYARGEQQEDSDIDIMILTSLEREEEIKRTEYDICDIAFEYLMKYSMDIRAIVINYKHFNSWLDVLPYYKNVETEGVVLIA